MQEITKFNKIIVANWKLNGSFSFVNTLINNIRKDISFLDKICIILCPPFPYIKYLNLDGFFKGAQDCSIYLKGPYTGEISASILKEIDCDFCIVGHSERRELFNENNYIVSKKTLNCIQENIVPILCVGETLQQKNNHKTKKILIDQIKNCVPNVANNENLIIAYEPIWAIGTGLTPSMQEIAEIHNFIKNEIKGFNNYKVLYGGSVNSSNCKEILSLKNVDGVLIGGASINIEEFNKIISC